MQMRRFILPECAPSAPTVPAGAPSLHGPSPLSNAHQGSLLRWENINSLHQKQKELEPRASGRFLVAAPGSSRGKSGQKAPRPNRDRVCASARRTANPAAPSAPPPGRLHSPLPASRRWARGRRPGGAEVGGWGSPYRPDSVCVLLSTLAEGPLPLAITSLHRNFPPSSTQTLTPSSPPAQNPIRAPLPSPCAPDTSLIGTPRGGEQSISRGLWPH